MKKIIQFCLISILVIYFVVVFSPFSTAQFSHEIFFQKSNSITVIQAQKLPLNSSNSDGQKNDTINSNTNKEYPVIVDGETLFNIKVSIGNISPKTRAERMSEEITKFAENYSLPDNPIEINQITPEVFFISIQDIALARLYKVDAEANKTTLKELATNYQQKIEAAVKKYREKRSLKRIVQNTLISILITVIFLVLVGLLLKISPIIIKRIRLMKKGIIHKISLQNFQLISVKQQKIFLIGLTKIIIAIIIFILFFTYLGLIFKLFPQTQPYGELVFNSFKSAIIKVGESLLSYLPNLFMIAITFIITYYTVGFTKVFFNALENGNLAIPGFYQEWAQPTCKLIVVLIYALALAIIFPYLPGSDSPAFSGVSLFLGALFTFGSASAISNIVGGIIVIYTRAYQLGDLVKVGDVIGNVLEKTILSTRILTPNNQIVTIPNSNIVSNNIINYTATNRELNEPLILNTTITLGYDIPWRKIHQTLKEAAKATTNISDKHEPLVLQTSLNDFYVSYELKAYTKLGLKPSLVPLVYSELHQNIQDKCNEVGIEIMSPHFTALRDGNPTTIPENYLPPDYESPGFKINNSQL